MKEHQAFKAKTGQEYLYSLGRRLLWYFPFSQVKEVLSDYQEYFAVGIERGYGEEELMEQWGSPIDAAKRIVEENPQANTGLHIPFLREGIWGLVFLLSLWSLSAVRNGGFFFLVFGSVSVFEFFHGWERAVLEPQFIKRTPVSGKLLLIYVLVLVLVGVLEAGMQYMLKNVGEWTWIQTVVPVSRVGWMTDTAYAFFEMLFLLLCLWMLVKSIKDSVWYFPWSIHACGAMLFAMDIRKCLHSMDVSPGYEGLDFWYSLVYYGAGLGLSVIFAVTLKAAGAGGQRERKEG